MKRKGENGKERGGEKEKMGNLLEGSEGGQARREPQLGFGKHSRGPQTFSLGPSGEKIFEFFLFKIVHSCVF